MEGKKKKEGLEAVIQLLTLALETGHGQIRPLTQGGRRKNILNTSTCCEEDFDRQELDDHLLLYSALGSSGRSITTCYSAIIQSRRLLLVMVSRHSHDLLSHTHSSLTKNPCFSNISFTLTSLLLDWLNPESMICCTSLLMNSVTVSS